MTKWGPSEMTNGWEKAAEKRWKKNWWQGDTTDWRLVIIASDMFWTGSSFVSSLWDAQQYRCMNDAREHFVQIEKQGGTNIEVKRIRMFCADRNPKHVIPNVAP